MEKDAGVLDGVASGAREALKRTQVLWWGLHQEQEKLWMRPPVLCWGYAKGQEKLWKRTQVLWFGLPQEQKKL